MDLNRLNEMQRKAVLKTEGPILMLAGAGSGKTRVLTNRIAYIIEELDVYPSNILAFTFTNKAAKEMKERVKELIGDVSLGMWIGTFHSMCVRILRKYIDRIGYTKDFVIYDMSDQKTVIKQCMKELNIDKTQFPDKLFQSKISDAKNQLIGPKKYKEMYGGDFQLDMVCKVYDLYQRKLKTNNAMDFDDLIGKTLELFSEFPEVTDYYQTKFKYVHVDEYQDTNKAQYLLVRYLSGKHKNLCVVGDLDQSIYGWRGADIRNIRNFEKDYAGAEIIKLEQNYRSTQTILNAANEVIKNNSNRKSKNLWTDNDEGSKINYYMGQNEYDEGRYVANQVIKKVDAGERSYSDFAILYRTNAQSRVFEDTFLRAGIKYRMIGGQKFYERKEIKDAMSYLKVIQNPLDEVGVLRIINAPKRGVGAKTIEKIQAHARDENLSFYGSLEEMLEMNLLPKRVAAALHKFVGFINGVSDQKVGMSVTEILDSILDKTGYVQELKNDQTIESETRIENLRELISVTTEFDKRTQDGGLEDFLAEISLMADVDGLDDDEPGVLMMTMHSAKGLEFPEVFVAGLEENIFPSPRAGESDDDLEEERRLCYVAITRAEEELHMMHAYMRTQYGKTKVNPVSRFISEIPKEYINSVNGKIANRQKEKIVFDSNSSFTKNTAVKKSGVKAPDGEYKPGTKVKHKDFGNGMVITVTGSDENKILTIAFDSKGIKKLQVGFAPIEIVG